VKKDRSIIREACVETCEEAVTAQRRGADRIELCSRLDLDGVTPERAVMEETVASLSIPVKVMVRPRGGGFVYGEDELIAMEKQLDLCKSLGVKEVVFGLLNSDGTVDIESTARLAERASLMAVTFHKAIDCAGDILEETSRLTSIPQISSILTSGGKRTAMDGSGTIREMFHSFGDRFNVIAAGSITEANLDEVHSRIGAREYHGRKIVGELG
jgi:copper homeostasis protein